MTQTGSQQRRQYLPRRQDFSKPKIPPEPVIPGSDLTESTRHDSYQPRWPSPIDSWAIHLPRNGGYPRTRETLSLLPRIFWRHQHPALGCQPRSPECSTTVRSPLYAHAGLFRTPWVSQPDSPQVRSGTSEMSHFSLGYTKLRRCCASPEYTDLQSNFPQTLFGMNFTFSTRSTSYTSKYQSNKNSAYAIRQVWITTFIGSNSKTRPSPARTELQLPLSCHFWRPPPVRAGILLATYNHS